MEGTDVDQTGYILQDSLNIGKVAHDVRLSESSLTWVKKDDTPDKTVTVPIDEIVDVTKITGRKDDGGFEVVGFTISYIQHQKNFILRTALTQFLGSPEQGEEWSTKIQEALDQVEYRPRKMLVLVHPLSGNRSGSGLYNETAAAVFKQAGIETDVIISDKNEKRCEVVLASYDISTIDSLVLVGGDGFYHEAVNSLERRAMDEEGFDKDVADISLRQISLPIGIIPAGTDNTVAMGCYGCIDVETAALTIVKGQRQTSGLVAVHSQEELVSYAAVFVGYGVWADAIHYSETRRHFEALRYHLSFLEALLIRSHRQLNLNVEYLQPLMSKTKVPIDENAENDTEEQEQTEDSAYDEEWKSRQDVYIGVMLYVGDYFVDFDKTAKPEEDCTRLVLNKPGGGFQLTRFMYKYRSQDPNTLVNDNIEHMFIKEVKVKLNNPSDAETENGKKELMIDIDGEICHLKEPEFSVMLHPKVVQLFASAEGALLLKQNNR